MPQVHFQFLIVLSIMVAFPNQWCPVEGSEMITFLDMVGDAGVEPA